MTRHDPTHARDGVLYSTVGLVALLSFACESGPPRELGYTVEEQARALSQNAPQESFSTPMTDFDGRWVGEADNPLGLSAEDSLYTFPSGSRTIVMELRVTDDRPDRLTGTIRFGAGAPPPPPSDAALGYPVDVDYTKILSYFGEPLMATWQYGTLPPYEGFAYSLSKVVMLSDYDGEESERVADGVMTLAYSTHEQLDPWCALQEPIPDGRGGFECQGTTSYLPETGCTVKRQDAEGENTFEPIDCNRGILCSTARCECDESSCRASSSGEIGNPSGTTTGSQARLTLRRTGDELVGVLEHASFLNERRRLVPVGPLHFRRAD